LPRRDGGDGPGPADSGADDFADVGAEVGHLFFGFKPARCQAFISRN
jgi:hypothetical protein